jgi:hypothetical protein
MLPADGTHRCRDNEADFGTPRRQLSGYVIAIRRQCGGVIFVIVGWVERSETHQLRTAVLMGFAALNPSYKVRFITPAGSAPPPPQ